MKQLPKEIRLAYLIHLMKDRIITGKFTKNHAKRYLQLDKALRIEKVYNDISGYMFNGRIIVNEAINK